ncbi:MAG TPA: hypothetical protein VF272_03120 [Candidatus Saccharimonadia bacterium]
MLLKNGPSMISTSFITFAEQFSATHPVIEVTGEYYELPDRVVYTSAAHPLEGGGRVEVNTTTADTPPDFEWKHEVTINDKQRKQFIHLIVRHDDSVVETYGKTILPVNTERAIEIMAVIDELLNA